MKQVINVPKFLYYITVLIVIFILNTKYYIPNTVYAAGSISVTPQIQTIDLRTDSAQTEVKYKNTTPDTLELTLSLQDFDNYSENGVPDLINIKDQNNYKYGLTSWVKLSTNDIVLKPGEEKPVIINIEKERLSVGGHYAAVLAEIKQPNVKSRDVRVKAVLAALLLVRADSKYNSEEGKIRSLTFDNSLLTFPQKLDLRFENTGNIDVTPHGIIEIYDIFGRRVGRGIINEDSAATLPESIRKYTVSVNNESNLILPGPYIVKTSVNFGISEKKISSLSNFFYLGLPYFVLIIVVPLLLAAFLVRKLKRRGNKLN